MLSVGIRESDKGIGPWVTPKDAKDPEDNKILIRAIRILDQGRGPVAISR